MYLRTEHEINQAYEDHLDRAWEEYNEEGETEEQDVDFYAEADRFYEEYRDQESLYE